MLRIFMWLLFVLLASLSSYPSSAQQPMLPEVDRIRIAEAFKLAQVLQDRLWEEWSKVPFALLLVTPEKEFLIRHSSPSEDFVEIGYDSILNGTIHVRDRVFQPNLRATFPAVGAISTIVIGQAENTGLSSTFWIVMVLHEHFHQLQNSQPDYYQAVDSLDLAGDDQTGMWMLNYTFPYDSTEVNDYFSKLSESLLQALRAIDEADFGHYLSAYLDERRKLRDIIKEDDYKYFSFQLWQEGVARYTEYKIAKLAADEYKPSAEFHSLDDYISFEAVADSIYRKIQSGLAHSSLAEDRRTAFYPFGAAEALLLDAANPDWQRHYFKKKFYLEKYIE